MPVKNRDLLLLLEYVPRETFMEEWPDTSNLDYTVSCISEDAVVLYLVETANFYVTNQTKTNPFYISSGSTAG